MNENEEELVVTTDANLDKLSLDKVPLKVHLEVARFQLSLDELQKLKVGQKLPLAMDPHLVHLTINGKAVGRGEIVEVGDLVGVKILEMYK
jgi:flagellar motor switch/type III secretory pathway protein FliN